MELKYYFQVIRRRIWVVFFIMVGVMVAAFSVSVYLPKNFSATTKIRINLSPHSDPSYPQLIYADRIMNTYVEIATSNSVLNALRDRLDLQRNQPANIDVEIIPETEIIKITVEDQDRQLTSKAANTLAGMLVEHNPMHSGKIYVIDPAIEPGLPSLSDHLKITVLGLILGGVFGVGLAFLIENLDAKLHTADQIREIIDLPVIGEVPTLHRWSSGKYKLVDRNHVGRDAFRRIFLNLFCIASDQSIKTIMVSSAQPKEGKSAVLANLARCFAEDGHSVIVVDADLHRPSLHRYFRVDHQRGVLDVLSGFSGVKDIVQDSQIERLKVVTVGMRESSGKKSLTEDWVREFLSDLKNMCEFVFIDSPAFLGVSDAAILASAVDGVLFVARPGTIKKSSIQYTCEQFKNMDVKSLGLVLNRVSRPVPAGYSRYYQPRKVTFAKVSSWMGANNIRLPNTKVGGFFQKDLLQRKEATGSELNLVGGFFQRKRFLPSSEETGRSAQAAQTDKAQEK